MPTQKTETPQPDLVVEARELLKRASRIHALCDSDPKTDEDVSWLIEALADESAALREQLAELTETIERRAGKYCDRPEDMPLSAIINIGFNVLESRLAEVKKEREPHCWHCGIVLAYAPKLRCEECPAECDVVNCDAFGCVDKTAEQHLDSWK